MIHDSGRVVWNAVAGPVAAVVASAWRIRWICTSATFVLLMFGESLGFLTMAPALVAKFVHQSLNR